MKISCIDIGGTYIKSGVLEDGVLTDVEETPTDGGGRARAMLSAWRSLRQTPGVERVGVSTAGEVDARTGVIRLSDNIPGYTGLNPRQIPEGELGLPVAVENDVNAAAAGRIRLRRGAGRTGFPDGELRHGRGRCGVYRRPAVPWPRGQRGGSSGARHAS